MEKILEAVIVDEDSSITKYLSRDPMKTFSVHRAIYHNKVSLSDITLWQQQISGLIYGLYTKNVCCTTNVDITRVMIYPDRKLVDTKIITNATSIDALSEVRLINTMLCLHSSMFSTINSKHYSPEDFIKSSILTIIGNHFCTLAASNSSLFQFTLFFEYIHKCVESGMLDDIYDFLINNGNK